MYRSPGAPLGLTVPVQRPARSVVAVVVTYDRVALLRCCLESILAQRRPPEAIIVVDDASPGPGTTAAIAAFSATRAVRMPTCAVSA